MMESDWAEALLLGLLVAAVIMVLFVAFRAYRPLLFLLALGMAFSGSQSGVAGSMVLLRYGALLSLAVLGFQGLSRLRFSGKLMLGLAVYMILTSCFSIHALYSIQVTVAFFLLCLGVIGATSAYVQDIGQVRKVLAVIALVALVWCVVMLMPGYQASYKYQSALGRGQSLAIATGILAPFLLWSFFQTNQNRFFRYLSLCAFVILIPLLVMMGQRIGIFSAVIGAFPLVLLRLDVRRILLGVITIVVVSVATVQVLGLLRPDVKDMLKYKFIEKKTDMGGRDLRWRLLLNRCIESPVIGHGGGMGDAAVAQYFGTGAHNSYLGFWYDYGFVGLLSLLTLIGVTFYRLATLMRRPCSETKEAIRLLFGVFLALASGAFFESTLASPTAIHAGLFLLVFALSDVLWSFSNGPQQGCHAAYAYEPEEFSEVISY